MAFNPDEYLQKNKSAFDPDAYLAKESKQPEEKSGALQAAVEHYGNAATMGYLPQIQAVVEKVLPNPNRKLDAELKEKGFSLPDEKTYIENRDDNIKRLAQQKVDHPTASTVGDVAGIVGGGLAGGAALKGLGLAKNIAKVGGRLGQAAKSGALMGAVANPGDTEGEASPLQLYSRLKGAAFGGLVGAGSQGLAELLPLIKSGAKKAGTKLGEALTGVPEAEINTYAKQTDQVDKLFKKSGGDVSAIADDIRDKFQTSIQGTRQKLNMQIATSLKGASQERNVDVSSVIKSLQDAKANTNTNLYPETASQLEEMIGKIKGLSTGSDTVNIQEMQDIKTFLQDRAKNAYMNGQIFPAAGPAQRAAKEAGREARVMMDNFGPPEIQKANRQLEELHRIESRMNKNLIAPDKPEAALVAAGSGVNTRNKAFLSRLSKVTGTDFVNEAEKLAAAKRFGNPQLTPVDTTGKSLFRMGLGGGLGYLVGGQPGILAGAALTSPAALKVAIKGGKGPSGLLGGAMNAFSNNPATVQALAALTSQKAQGGPKFDPSQFQNILENKDLIEQFKNSPDLIQNVEDPLLRAQIRKKIGLNRNPSSVEKSKDDSPMKRRIQTKN